MPTLFDLPREIRLKILRFCQEVDAPYWLAINLHPPTSLVNRQLREESLTCFYLHHRWSFCIWISQDGTQAHMNPNTIKYLKTLQREKQLWRIHKLRLMYSFPKVWDFTGSDDPALRPFRAYYAEPPCFYDTFFDILRTAPKLRLIEFAWMNNAGKDLEKLNSAACLYPFQYGMLPESCKYQIGQSKSTAGALPVQDFANFITEAIGKPIEVIA